MGKQFLDASGLNQYTQALKNGTLVVKEAIDASNAKLAEKVPASGIQGIISLSNLPAGALDTLVKVANKAARLLLTDKRVQLGDTVQEEDTGNLYLVVDESKLSPDGSTPGTEDAFVEYTAGRAAFADDASRADFAKVAKDASNADYAKVAKDASHADEVEWSGVKNTPSEYKPAAHTHGAADVSILTGYSKAQTNTDVTASDSLLLALGKIEKKADDASAAARDHVQDASTINMTNYQMASSVNNVLASDNALVAIGKVEKRALDASNTADWDGITNVPSEFVPEDHDAAKVVSLETYNKSAATGDISKDDSLVEALAKLENKAEAGADTSIGPDTISAIINQTWTPTA